MVLRCKPLEKENKRLLIQRLIAAAVVILLMLGLSQPMFALAALGVVGLFVVLSENEEGMRMMFFLLPFGNIFKSSPESTSFFTYLTIIFAVKLLLSQKKIKIGFLVAWGALLVFQVAGSFMDYKILIKQASLLLLIYGYFQCCKPMLKDMVMALSCGVVISCSIGFFLADFPGLAQYMRMVRTYEISYDLLRFTGLYSDPNYLSLVLVVLMVALYGLMRAKQIGKIGWVLCGCMVFFGVQTISKSFFLMLFVALLLFIIEAIRHRRFAFLAILVTAVTIVVVLVMQGKIQMFDNILERLFHSDDFTTGRTDLLGTYLSHSFNDPIHLIVGTGVAAAPLGGLPHNTYIDFLYYYGLLGTFFFGLAMYYAISPIRVKFSLLNTSPLICFCIMIAALSYLQMYDFSYVLILVFALLKEGVTKPESPLQMQDTAA